MFDTSRIFVVIPALDEEQALGGVLARIPRWVDRVIVVDNGSTDDTPAVARAGGAELVHEPQRGYGRACLAGIRAARAADVIVFMDADGSDVPEQMERLVAPIVRDGFELAIGSRARGRRERGALSVPQRFGNVLASRLVSWLWGVRFTDLGPFRAVSRRALERLAMDAPTFGWTVQMQIRAASRGLACTEVPVDYTRRGGGRSKISGTVRGVYLAGTGILGCIAAEWLAERRARRFARTAASRDASP
jgi:glycosyltransferase involved in cell wall biosynthesis